MLWENIVLGLLTLNALLFVYVGSRVERCCSRLKEQERDRVQRNIAIGFRPCRVEWEEYYRC